MRPVLQACIASLADCQLPEWEPRPTSPSAIRLIHFGRLLDDKLQLKGTVNRVSTSSYFRSADRGVTDCRFSESAPNVVHMSVKPQEAVEEEENAKASGKGSIRRGRDAEDTDAGCRCVIL